MRQGVLITSVAAIVCLYCGVQPVRAQCNTVQQGKLLANDAAANDSLGYSIAVSGDTGIVGADADDNTGGTNAGAAYVYFRTGGTWAQQAKLTASDGAANDQFGISVAISGDTAIVGANGSGATDTGAAYVFVRSGTVWSLQAKLMASDAAAADDFGWSVAISGDTAIIGADGDDNAGGSNAGSAYVFVRSGTVWSQQAKLLASDAAANDDLGYAVALDGNTAVVSSTQHAPGGAAYVFVRNGTVWTQQSRLLASDAAAGDGFGISVGISGDSAIIGAWNNAHAGINFAGAAYVFERTGTTWGQQAKLIASDATTLQLLGTSVAISGETAMAGAIDDSSGTGTGEAYVFVRSGCDWVQAEKLLASDAAANDSFGIAVALSGNTATVGAYRDDNAGGTDAGSAYAFLLGLDCDGDGIPNAADACPSNAPALPVDSTGRPLRDCNNDCLVNGADIACMVNEILNQ